MNQAIIDKAVNIATRAALNGNPVKRVEWVPPRSGTDNFMGVFAIEYAEPLCASDTPPWEV